MRYSLKKALFSLGPSGYPFERYFARILSHYGYSVEVGRTIDGYCVQHEVDVIAQNDNEHIFVECKYHSKSGTATDVKTALYIHARYLDIKKAYEKIIKNKNVVVKCWLVTNTRCTYDAMQYAECSDFGIVSWRYPEDSSLEKLIEDKRLYPVTILPAARKGPLEILFKKDFMLAQDIADMDEKTFLRNSGLDYRVAKQLKKQADEICPCIR
jgi:Holliday junction resolvase-like predicted endonuclease